MPRKKAATATKTKSTRSTKSKPSKEQVIPEVPQKQSFFAQYLRFGESYTSLVLGIIVVIIATVLLLSFVHNRQAELPQENQEQLTLTEGEVDGGAIATASASVTPTEIPTTTVPTATSVPTMTTVPTQPVKATSTPKPTATATVTPSPTKVQPTPTIEKKIIGGEKTYTVGAGDTLWTIAEKAYKSGYNWVDIARANKLSDPNDIHVGNKLILPKVTAKIATVNGNEIKGEEKAKTVITDKKITGTTYKIAHGDTLWDIAVRAYGDGYAWTKIADANKLKENPGVIHVGNTIKIPRQ